MTILITGGAGFIGSALIRFLIAHTSHHIVNVDKLTYAGNLATLEAVSKNPRYHFEHVDVCSRDQLNTVFKRHEPSLIMHLAAESHVDRSIDDPITFVQTNVIGTFNLLEASRTYWQSLPETKRFAFRFLHVSTDEVYGSLQQSNALFTEETPYAPSSPYSATKASADHLVRAWHKTYGLPILLTNCSNNYGPYQYPEKLIPLTLQNALAGKPLPLYGDGKQVRDWLYVEDHVRALYEVLRHGTIGQTYNIGGHNEQQNIHVVQALCNLLEELAPSKPKGVPHYSALITLTKDRLGHDLRYAIDASKIQTELGWRPLETFETGLRKTVLWTLEQRCKETA